MLVTDQHNILNGVLNMIDSAAAKDEIQRPSVNESNPNLSPNSIIKAVLDRAKGELSLAL